MGKYGERAGVEASGLQELGNHFAFAVVQCQIEVSVVVGLTDVVAVHDSGLVAPDAAAACDHFWRPWQAS